MRKGDLKGVDRLRGAERLMCNGRGVARSLVRRLWMVLGWAAVVREVIRVVRRSAAAGEGYPALCQSVGAANWEERGEGLHSM